MSKSIEELALKIYDDLGPPVSYDAEYHMEYARRLQSALSIQQEADAKDGCVLVPKEPTEEMLDSVWGKGVNWKGLIETADNCHIADIYKAMISAAPSTKG